MIVWLLALQKILGLVFMFGAVSKALHPMAPVIAIQALTGIGPNLTSSFVLLLIALELYFGLNLIKRGSSIPISVVVFLGLMTAGATVAWILGLSGDCGCFPGLVNRQFGALTTGGNLGLLLTALIIRRIQLKENGRHQQIRTPLDFRLVTFTVCVGAVAILPRITSLHDWRGLDFTGRRALKEIFTEKRVAVNPPLVLVAFLSTECPSCLLVLQDWVSDLVEVDSLPEATAYLVTQDRVQLSRMMDSKTRTVLHIYEDRLGQLAHALGIRKVPAVVLISNSDRYRFLNEPRDFLSYVDNPRMP